MAIVCMAMPAFAQVIDNKVLVPYRQGDRWGYSDTLARVVVPPVYDSVSVLVNFGVLYQKGKMGAINSAGKILATPTYDEVSAMKEPDFEDGFILRKGSLRGYMTLNGKLVVPVMFEEIIHDNEGVLTVRLKNKLGLYNMSGRQLLPAVYDAVNIPFEDEKFPMDTWRLAQKGKSYFIVNRETGKLLPYKYKEQENGPWEPEESLMAQDAETSGISYSPEDIRKQLGADQVTDFVFNNGTPWPDNRYYLVTKNGKQGLYDKYREAVIIAPVYDSVLYIVMANAESYLNKPSRYLAAVKKDGRTGLITDSGAEVLPFIYDRIGPLSGNVNGFELVQDGKSGVLLLYTFYPVIAPKYEQISFVASLPVNPNWNFSLYRVQYQGRTGYVGENGVEYFK